MDNQCLIKIDGRKYISDNPYIAVSGELIKWCKVNKHYDDVIVRLKIGDKYKNVYAQYIPEEGQFTFIHIWRSGEPEVEIIGCYSLQDTFVRKLK